ncbi:MAG TPA: hypothetical protein VLL73_07660, partial [Desulfurivibrionaceae bacterium]|nr:hypothetical protein [Desulfurivibrionaceae bacterium]
MPSANQQIGPRTSFRRRMFLLLGGLTICVAASFTAINLYTDIKYTRDHSAEKARLLATHLAASARLPLFADDRTTLQRLATEIAGTPDVHTAIIVNPFGQVLASAGEPLHAMQDGIKHQALITAPKGSLGAEEALGLGESDTPPLGSAWIIMDDEKIRQGINRQIASAVGVALSFSLLFVYLSALIVRWVGRAMAPLQEGISAIQGGDFGVRIPTSPYQELASATAKVNDLAASLQQRDEEIRHLHQELLDAMKLEVREERRQVMAKLIQTNRMTSLGLL